MSVEERVFSRRPLPARDFRQIIRHQVRLSVDRAPLLRATLGSSSTDGAIWQLFAPSVSTSVVAVLIVCIPDPSSRTNPAAYPLPLRTMHTANDSNQIIQNYYRQSSISWLRNS
jgi:hypothetical protein